MDQRISLITLGVQNMEASGAFYDGLGWTRVDTTDGVIAYDLIGQTLGLYPLEKLAEDLGIPIVAMGNGMSSLGYNTPNREEVDRIIAAAQTLGAHIIKKPTEVFWGGYHGYFTDLDGHLWEIAHNPFSPLGPKGEFQWNGAG